mgnify:FL=1
MGEFSYLSQKVIEATTVLEPFEHIQIDNFLSEEHFEKVITNSQIHFEVVDTHEELIDTLESQDYDHLKFQRTQLYGNLNYKTRKRKPHHPENYKGLIKK